MMFDGVSCGTGKQCVYCVVCAGESEGFLTQLDKLVLLANLHNSCDDVHAR